MSVYEHIVQDEQQVEMIHAARMFARAAAKATKGVRGCRNPTVYSVSLLRPHWKATPPWPGVPFVSCAFLEDGMTGRLKKSGGGDFARWMRGGGLFSRTWMEGAKGSRL
eukprot:TRINITY_DN10558_c0_g1_i2.p1 TRINITY_DN10558_c0_g1~~TRINITY_DN10558_c0_g1_i2.p1  ORF type:complete len:109 (+),score=3.43 TRINITY_DN10558_c0_g1_i2:65-391(+)